MFGGIVVWTSIEIDAQSDIPHKPSILTKYTLEGVPAGTESDDPVPT